MDDVAQARLARARHRLGRDASIFSDAEKRLKRAIGAVLVAAPSLDPADAHPIIEQAAELAETLGMLEHSDERKRLLQFRAAVLYELADQPAMAAATAESPTLPRPLRAFFARDGAFSALGSELPAMSPDLDRDLALQALAQDAIELERYVEGPDVPLLSDETALEIAASTFALDIDLTDVRAFAAAVRRRARRTLRHRVSGQTLSAARAAKLPGELWAPQAAMLDAGLVGGADTWGIAAPTGTGKTLLARLLALDALTRSSSAKVLYLVPTNALIGQIVSALDAELSASGRRVSAVTPRLVSLDHDEDARLRNADVLVLTPEKADLLLRIGAPVLDDVRLVIVDEAHHIEDGSRGILLELYLLRLRTRLATKARYVLLSAVAPNVGELAEWIDSRAVSRLYTRRPTHMRVGRFRVVKSGTRNVGEIVYVDGSVVRFDGEKQLTDHKAGIAQLALRVGQDGAVLVVAQGKGNAENIARQIADRLRSSGSGPLTQQALDSDEMQRLDARLEREAYPEIALRELARWGVAYHHAGLPPRVRESIEAAISSRHIRFVVATTTLADGVNFPFSTVIVQSLSVRDAPAAGVRPTWRLITPRTFWNIAGRAGRPGLESEGQVLLYEPSLGLDRVNAALGPYLNPEVQAIPKVESALAAALSSLNEARIDASVTDEQLVDVTLDSEMPRPLQGLLNHLRVGIAHARATDQQVDGEELFSQTLASTTLIGSTAHLAKRLFIQQANVVDDFVTTPGMPPLNVVAELGLSLGTLKTMREYVADLDDWQLERMRHAIYGPRINFSGLKYVVGPVLARMSELEGRSLSGIYTDLVDDWARGKPFSALPLVGRMKKREDLVSLLYSQIAYMLPWGLWAFDRFVSEEAGLRRIEYDHQVRQLAHLIDSGVPDFAGLALVHAGLERTDASRLSTEFFAREAHTQTDVIRWVRGLGRRDLRAIVRGLDRRRLDYDLTRVVMALQPPED